LVSHSFFAPLLFFLILHGKPHQLLLFFFIKASPVLGLEVAGLVVGLGEGVEGWAVGERVMALVSGGGELA
jgi:NADPH:quinone reductase-like Zn-dependent oxidoreductase